MPDGSVVDLFAKLGSNCTTADVNAAVQSAAATSELKGVLEYTEDPIVSSDIIGNPHSSIFDATFTQVAGGRYLKALSWYDNEWGYSSRVCDVLRLMSRSY